MLFPYWVSPPWPCLGFGPRPGIRGVSRRCLASCLFLVVMLGVVPVLITAYPLHRVLVGVSFSCLGSGFVRFESRRGLALVRDCLSTSSALGLSWVGLRPVFSTASVFVVAPSPVRCGSRGSCCLAGPLLARYWLACGTERHCTEQPYRTVLGRRGLRAFYEVTPPWVCLDRPQVLPAVSGSHSLLG